MFKAIRALRKNILRRENLITGHADIVFAAITFAFCAYLAWRNLIQQPLSFNFFIDELFSLSHRDFGFTELRRNYMEIHETHPANFDYLLGRFSHLFNGSLAALRGISALANFASLALLFVYLRGQQKKMHRPVVYSAIAFCFLLFLCNDVVLFWTVLARSYAWQGLTFMTILLAAQRRRPWPYFLALVALGNLHFFGTALALAIALFESPRALPQKAKLALPVFLLPTLQPLFVSMSAQALQPERLGHYPAPSFEIFSSAATNSFRFYGPLLALSLLLGAWCARRLIAANWKAYLNQYRVPLITLLTFVFISALAILLDKRWMDKHTFFLLQHAAIILFFAALSVAKKKLQVAVCAGLILTSAPMIKWSTEVNFFPRAQFSGMIRYVGQKGLSNQNKIFLCYHNLGREFTNFLNAFYHLDIKMERVKEICDTEKIKSSFAKEESALVVRDGMPEKLFGALKPLLGRQIYPGVWVKAEARLPVSH